MPKDLQISLFLAIFAPAFDQSTLTRGERRHASLLCRSSASDANALPNAKGKLSEWSKEPHSKCGVRITSYRGFESLTFRKQNMRPVCPSLLEQAGLLFWLQGCRRQALGITQKSLTFRLAALPGMPLAQIVDWGELRSKAASQSLRYLFCQVTEQ